MMIRAVMLVLLAWGAGCVSPPEEIVHVSDWGDPVHGVQARIRVLRLPGEPPSFAVTLEVKNLVNQVTKISTRGGGYLKRTGKWRGNPTWSVVLKDSMDSVVAKRSDPIPDRFKPATPINERLILVPQEIDRILSTQIQCRQALGPGEFEFEVEFEVSNLEFGDYWNPGFDVRESWTGKLEVSISIPIRP